MARMTRTTLVSMVQQWLRDKSASEVEVLANLVIRELNMVGLRFTRKRFTFTTTAPITDITVTVTQGSTSVTIDSGTFPATYDGQYIRIESSDTWYEISETVADTSFTIGSGFDGDDVAAGSSEVAFPRIELPSTIIDVHKIGRAERDPLLEVTDDLPLWSSIKIETREPSAYYHVEPVNTSDNMEIMLLDFPDDVYAYSVAGAERITRYDGASSKCGVPEKFEHVVFAGTMFYAVDQELGTEKSAYWRLLYGNMQREIAKSMGPSFRGRVGRVGSLFNMPEGVEPEIVTDNLR